MSEVPPSPAAIAADVAPPAAAAAPAEPEASQVVGEESILMDVTKENFFEKSNDFIEHVSKAAWISMDEEMTGIQLPNTPRPKKDDAPTDRYPTLKAVPERYSLIQLGISLFIKLDGDASTSGSGGNSNRVKFHVRRYKFTLFPPSDSSITREIVLSPGSVKFLAEDNNCNLNEWIQHGIPFCNFEMATRLLDKFRSEEIARLTPDNSNFPKTGRRVELTKPQDKDFHAQTMATLREWLDAALQPSEEGAYIMLPPCNSFLRRALYESIPLEYPNLILETVKQTNQIRVWRLSQAERKARNIRLLKEGFEETLTNKVGAWRIFMALTKACSGTGPESQAEHMALAATADQALEAWDGGSSVFSTAPRKPIPLVVHNGLQDLFFLLTHFHAPDLPDDWVDCKALIHSYFPVVYDTKTMATEYCHRENNRTRTHLAAVYEQTLLSYPRWNRSFTVDGKPQDATQFHDAGYDSYCTGAAFCGLASTIQTQHRQQQTQGQTRGEEVFSPIGFVWDMDADSIEGCHHYGRNKLHFFLSPYTIDLERDEDPLTKGMTKNSTFRIAGIPSSLTTRDIVRCLSGLTDTAGNTVNFEIVWVNDTCVMVGAMVQQYLTSSKDQLTALSKEHGLILFKALTSRFTQETITTLDGFDSPEGGIMASSSASIWNLWGLFGGGSKKRSMADSIHGSNKRRRIA